MMNKNNELVITAASVGIKLAIGELEDASNSSDGRVRGLLLTEALHRLYDVLNFITEATSQGDNNVQ
jgi:hypothetical protein